MENNCDILYSEDMQDRQTLEDKLKIINPFKLKKKDVKTLIIGFFLYFLNIYGIAMDKDISSRN